MAHDNTFYPGECREALKKLDEFLKSEEGRKFRVCTVCRRHYVYEEPICTDCLDMGRCIT